MIITEEQRRWWFATHPEYSWHRRRGRNKPSRGEDKNSERNARYQEGWRNGYQAIRNGKVPPYLDPEDKSPYAQGVHDGAFRALDEKEVEYQHWLDPLSMLLGTHPSRTLGRNLEKAGISKPSNEHHAHHIVEWRHWKADPARQVLEKYGIDLHGADNGMWLHRTYHYPLANSYRYIDGVNHILREAGKSGSKAEVLKALDCIKHSLSTGKFPL